MGEQKLGIIKRIKNIAVVVVVTVAVLVVVTQSRTNGSRPIC
jgi:hypothetical protein